MRRLAIELIVVTGAALLIAPCLAAQQRADSAGARRLAEQAQSRFERVRRVNLPPRNAGVRGQCDARIGRFCQYNEESDTIVAKESRAITRARAALLASLEKAAVRAPRDGWITGQRIRYLFEADDDSAALEVARSCAAERWWCDALRGLVLHETGASAASDSAFAEALSLMPESERCRWTDVTPLLDDRQRKRYGKVGCGRNEDVAARLWWLSDPFLTVAGNDRQAEHYSRHTMARILEPARIVYNLSWANDIREMIVRYGWARYWTQGPGTFSDPYGGAISGHEATPNYHFVPVSLSLDSIHEIDFDLDLDRSAERYSPVAANRLSTISPQVALFRRGDSAAVVVAFDVSHRKPFDSASVQSGLVLGPDDLHPALVTNDSARGSFTAMIDSRPHLLSLEVLSRDKRHAAWHRDGVWLAPREEGVELSDILLFTAGEADVRDLATAAARALPENRVRRERSGIYWEIYGLSEADSALPVRMTLTPMDRSAIRRLGESLGVISRTAPLIVGWTDNPSAGGISSRSMIVDFSLIPRGRYRMEVTVSPAGRDDVRSSRIVEVL
jgi:hypothetical protein